MLTIKNVTKIIGSKISSAEAEYEISNVWATENFYTFNMYSTTHSGWGHVIRLNRTSTKNLDGEKIYTFMDMGFDNYVKLSHMNNMFNLLNVLQMVVVQMSKMK